VIVIFSNLKNKRLIEKRFYSSLGERKNSINKNGKNFDFIRL